MCNKNCKKKQNQSNRKMNSNNISDNKHNKNYNILKFFPASKTPKIKPNRSHSINKKQKISLKTALEIK